jgi:hypothetical protein
MPKETTYGLQLGPPADRPQVPIVDVIWNRTGVVQIVSKATDAEGGRYMGDDYAAEAHFTDGMFVELDRAAINKLIRNLRRARDQAFGRDE